MGWIDEQFKSTGGRIRVFGDCICGGAKMKNFIEELYYGNINPNEKKFVRNTQYSKVLETMSRIENEVLNRFSDEDKKLFNDMINASDELSACTSVENFKMGFVLGVRMMIDCFRADEHATFIDM